MGSRGEKGSTEVGRLAFCLAVRGLVHEPLPEGEHGMLEDQRDVREPGDLKFLLAFKLYHWTSAFSMSVRRLETA